MNKIEILCLGIEEFPEYTNDNYDDDELDLLKALGYILIMMRDNNAKCVWLWNG